MLRLGRKGSCSECLLGAESGPRLRVGRLLEGGGSWTLGHARGMFRDTGMFTGHGLCASQLLLCHNVPHPSKGSGLNKLLLSPVSEGWTSGHLVNGLGLQIRAG